MSAHPKQIALEKTMNELCVELDNYLEDTFAGIYPIHPNRPKRGKAASPEYDGLFSTGIEFTLGYGSKFGRWYIVDIDIRTLSLVAEEEKEKVGEASIAKITELLPKYFPNRKIDVEKDGNVFKLVGDFSLGAAY